MYNRYDVNHQLNSDEIKVAANIMANDDLQFLNSVDSEHTVIAVDNYSFVADIVVRSYLEMDASKPMFLPMVISGHDVLLSLVPNADGTIGTFYNDSMGVIQDSSRYYIAKIVSYMLHEVDERVQDIKDISVFQQYANCCGLAVVSNVANIHNAYLRGSEVNTSVLYDGSDMENYYQNLGDNYVAPFLD